MARVVALIRGINLGASKRVAMADLRGVLEEAGYEEVRTLLQSGNVVLETKDSPAKLERAIERLIEKRFGLEVAVLARSTRDFRAIVKADPLGSVADDGSRYHVAFLSAQPKASALPKDDFAPERYEVRGREIYMWTPDGMRDSRLTKALGEKQIGVTATVRNWNTVTKLAALLD